MVLSPELLFFLLSQKVDSELKFLVYLLGAFYLGAFYLLAQKQVYNFPLIHSLFIQQILSKGLLCARHCSNGLGYSLQIKTKILALVTFMFENWGGGEGNGNPL